VWFVLIQVPPNIYEYTRGCALHFISATGAFRKVLFHFLWYCTVIITCISIRAESKPGTDHITVWALRDTAIGEGLVFDYGYKRSVGPDWSQRQAASKNTS